MAEKIKIGFYFARAAHKRLKGLAERDHRSMSGEVAWLIEQEWQQYVARLQARRAPRQGGETQDREPAPAGHGRTEGTA
jgi:hypothetical protein